MKLFIVSFLCRFFVSFTACLNSDSLKIQLHLLFVNITGIFVIECHIIHERFHCYVVRKRFWFVTIHKHFISYRFAMRLRLNIFVYMLFSLLRITTFLISYGQYKMFFLIKNIPWIAYVFLCRLHVKIEQFYKLFNM